MLQKSSLTRKTTLLALLVVLTVGAFTMVKSAPRIDQMVDRAYMLAARGIADLAASLFQEAAKTETSNVEFRLMGGMALQVSGKDQAALEAWQAADSLGDKAAPALIGDSLFLQGDLNGAEAAYKRALARQPGAVRPRLGLALVEESRGHNTAAIDLLKQLVEPQNKDDQAPVADAFYHLGRLYVEVAQHDDALAVLKKGVLYNPNHAAMYLLLGKAYEAKGAVVEAIHAYERTLQLEPDLPAASEGLRRLQKKN